MGKQWTALLGIVVVAGFLVASGAVYTVDETQQVVITQFGRPIGKPITRAGLKFKLPFIQTANYFEKRLLQWDGDANQIPTLDKRFIWVDTTARWKIVDPLRFMQSVGSEPSAQTRLDDIIDAASRSVISSHNLVEVIRNTNRLVKSAGKEDISASGFSRTDLATIQLGRRALSEQILAQAAKVVEAFGIQLVDVKIKRINYIQQVRKEVYERMKEERLRIAQRFRSEGQGKKSEIEGQVDKELKEIESTAYRKAQTIRGKADAEAIRIYAEAYNKDPEFFAFVKTLDSYKKTINQKTTLILSTQNALYEQLKGKDLGGE